MPWTAVLAGCALWSALNITSGRSAAQQLADVAVHVDLADVAQPRSRSASTTPRPLVSDTSRSADHPPISTTT